MVSGNFTSKKPATGKEPCVGSNLLALNLPHALSWCLLCLSEVQLAKDLAKALREQPVSPEELQTAKQIVLRELASEQRKPETLIRRLFWLNQAGMPLDGASVLRKQVEQCQAGDLQNAAKLLLAAKQMTVGRFTPNPRM